MARVIVRFRCIGWAGLWIELGFGFNVRVRASLRFRVTMRCG